MLKKNFMMGGLSMLIAGLFFFGAIGKTISDDPTVLALQWFCAAVFLGLGMWNFAGKRS